MDPQMEADFARLLAATSGGAPGDPLAEATAVLEGRRGAQVDGARPPAWMREFGYGLDNLFQQPASAFIPPELRARLPSAETAATMMLGAAPGSGDYMAARDAIKAADEAISALGRGDYWRGGSRGVDALTATAGILPFVPYVAGMTNGGPALSTLLRPPNAKIYPHDDAVRFVDDLAAYRGEQNHRLLPPEAQYWFQVGELNPQMVERLARAVPPEHADAFRQLTPPVYAGSGLLDSIVDKRRAHAGDLIRMFPDMIASAPLVVRNPQIDRAHRPVLGAPMPVDPKRWYGMPVEALDTRELGLLTGMPTNEKYLRRFDGEAPR